MATKSRFILDDPFISAGPKAGTQVNLSDWVNKAELVLEHVEAEGRHTFGADGIVRILSTNYSYTLAINFEVDGYGANELDAIWTALMPLPLGSNVGGVVDFTLSPNVVREEGKPDVAGVPNYKGSLIAASWAPLGGGEVNMIVTNDRTFNGTGPLVVTKS